MRGWNRVSPLAGLTLLLTGCGEGTERQAAPALQEWVVASSGGTHPTVAVDGEGTTYVAWVALDPGTGAEGAHDVLLVRIPPTGDPEPPLRVNDQPGDAAPHEQAPAQVAVGARGEVYVAWQKRIPVEGLRFGASSVRFARSLDGGRTFEPAFDLADYTGPPPASHTFHSLLVLADGRVAAAWLDGRDGGPAVRVAVSRDRGATFGPSVVVVEEVCPCCRTVLAEGPGGELVVGWRHIRTTANGLQIRDPSVAASSDGGLTWSAPVPVVEDGWVHEGCPHAGPALAFDAEGALHALRYTGNPGMAGVHHARRLPGAPAFEPPTSLLEGEWVPPSRVALARLQGRGLMGVWEDGTTEPHTFMEGRFLPETGLDSSSLRRTEGRFPALAASSSHWSLVWVRGEEIHLRRESSTMAEASRETTTLGRFRRLAAGDPVPEWSSAFLDGTPFHLSDLRGQVTVLTVWATWCAPCRKEMPALQALWEHFREDGLQVVGVSVDDRLTASQIPGFLEAFEIGFPVTHDPEGTVNRAFMTMGVPESFLIGRDGTLLHRWIGAFDPAAPAELERVRNALQRPSIARAIPPSASP
jgi:peroxiredoxin